MKEGMIAEIIGWYGTVAIVAAYAFSSFGMLRPGSLVHQMLNLTGAVAIVIISLKKKAYQPAVLNMVWSLIAIIALLGLLS